MNEKDYIFEYKIDVRDYEIESGVESLVVSYIKCGEEAGREEIKLVGFLFIFYNLL